VLRLLLQILQSPTHDEKLCQNQKAKVLITGLSLEFLVTSQQLIKLRYYIIDHRFYSSSELKNILQETKLSHVRDGGGMDSLLRATPAAATS
jgi:hypothetical protein